MGIDLSADLAGFDGDEGPGAAATDEIVADFTRARGRGGYGHRVPLAQLQAEGFNTTPPPGYGLGGQVHPQRYDHREALRRLLEWPDMDEMKIEMKLWLQGDPPPGS